MTAFVPTRPSEPRPDGEILHEVTRSICPVCRAAIDAQVLLRDGEVFMRKRCPEHGWFEGLIYADARAYVEQARFNKPGQAPLRTSTEVDRGCPFDCGLCPEHRQHTCLALIEVSTACNLDCPVCFANAGSGFNLSLAEVESMLDRFVELEGHPEVVQFSGGEPTIHPDLVAMLDAAQQRDIRYTMVNTNGLRIAEGGRWFDEFAARRPLIYLQFDGLTDDTYRVIRGEPLLETKLRALDRLAEADLHVMLVAAIERDVNEHEVGPIIEFGLKHQAVRGVMFQPVTHTGRHPDHDPMRRMTIPDVLRQIDIQAAGTFRSSDFVPIPCCFPTCSSVTYAYLGDAGEVIPLPRILDVEQYLDYITNRSLPAIDRDILHALEGLWSAGSVPGDASAGRFACAACDLDLPALTDLARRVFMVQLRDFLDPWAFDVKKAMKCCIGILQDDGRMIPFCTYNTVGYREETRARLAMRRRGRALPVAQLVGLAAGGAMASRIGDRHHGQKRGWKIFVSGVALTVAAFSVLLFAAIPNLPLQIVLYLIINFANIVALANLGASQADVIPARMRGTGFATAQFLITIGSSTGSLIVGVVSGYFIRRETAVTGGEVREAEKAVEEADEALDAAIGSGQPQAAVDALQATGRRGPVRVRRLGRDLRTRAGPGHPLRRRRAVRRADRRRGDDLPGPRQLRRGRRGGHRRGQAAEQQRQGD